jgi:hypothetical protein
MGMDDAREFEWDEAKRLTNIDKHGIDFEDIAPAFDDETALHVPDHRMDYGEERVIMIARCRSTIMSIVYTMRGERTRIISARFANQRERATYERA